MFNKFPLIKKKSEYESSANQKLLTISLCFVEFNDLRYIGYMYLHPRSIIIVVPSWSQEKERTTNQFEGDAQFMALGTEATSVL